MSPIEVFLPVLLLLVVPDASHVNYEGLRGGISDVIAVEFFAACTVGQRSGVLATFGGKGNTHPECQSHSKDEGEGFP